MSSNKMAQFFPHDQDAADDPKLAALEADMRGLGTGIYWRTVENLHKQGGYLPTDYKLLAYIFRNCTPEELRHVVEDFGLFHFTEEGAKFYSERVLANLNKRDSISKARRNARNGVGAGSPGEARETPQEAPKGSGPGNYTAVLLNAASRGFRQEEHQTLLGYAGPKSDLIAFLETMFFVKGCASPVAEVTRFIQYYQPTGWKRKGEEVTDRVSLISGWKPEEGARKITSKAGLNVLRSAYNEAKTAEEPGALFIITQTKGIELRENEVTISTAREAAEVLGRHLHLEGCKVQYKQAR